MFDILGQMNPVTLMIVIALTLLSIGGALILRLVRKGASKPADIVNATKARIERGKARKEAVRQAEAAIAEPVANSRLSRIGARSAAGEPGEATQWDAPEQESEPETVEAVDFGHDDAAAEPDVAETISVEPEAAEAVRDDEEAFEAVPFDHPDPFADAPEDMDTERADDAFTGAGDDDAADALGLPTGAPFDFADPANHPRSWGELVALIDALDQALTRPWAEDRMTLQLSRDQLAASTAGDEAAMLALSRQLAATDLARTINSAAREQAAEVVAVVRDFAHQTPFDADECAAVMNGLAEIEWMAVARNDDGVSKRTLPLTVSAPEAPLWVEDARTTLERLRRDLAA